MKSLLISSVYYPPQVGGISSFMAGVAAVLGPSRVCCLTGVRASAQPAAKEPGARVYRRPTAFARAKPIQAVGWGAAITQIIAQERPEIVQLATAYDGYLGLWLRRWFKLPFVVYAHGNEILDLMQGCSETPRLALREADGVLAVSRFTAGLVLQAGVHPDRIHVVYTGCDVDRFRPASPNMELRRRLLGTTHTGPVLLTVGTLTPRKGHDMVIRALPRLLEKVADAVYLVIGDGPSRAYLEAVAVSTGVRDHVIFAGQVPDSELPDVYALSDVFVMPSRDQPDTCDVEGFGLVFLEANACGKPVVGGRSGGIPEAIADGVTGLLVNPRDPEDIASCLARILTAPDLARELGEQGRLRVTRDFTWTHVRGRIEKAMDGIPCSAGALDSDRLATDPQ